MHSILVVCINLRASTVFMSSLLITVLPPFKNCSPTTYSTQHTHSSNTQSCYSVNYTRIMPDPFDPVWYDSVQLFSILVQSREETYYFSWRKACKVLPLHCFISLQFSFILNSRGTLGLLIHTFAYILLLLPLRCLSRWALSGESLHLTFLCQSML